MSGPAEMHHVERFRQAVASRLGLRFEDSQAGRLAVVLASRVLARSLASEAYLDRLESPEVEREEVRALARELTIGETYFFRHMDQFRALCEAALRDRMIRRRESRTLRILCAGCSSGEEPYSVSILLRDVVDPSWKASIRAVDVDVAALARAAKGVYSEWALRETPEEARRRWFRREGRDYVLRDEPRSRVTFEERNLAEPEPGLWQAESYDIVFCRNVLMYFTSRKARELVERIAGSLAPGGYLFLGHAETLRGLSQAFHLLHTHGSFYYRRREEGFPESARHEPAPEELAVDAAPIVRAVEAAGSWVEAIGRASDRIHELARETGAVTAGASAAGRAEARQPCWDLGSAMELLHAERFDDALDLVQGLPEEAGSDSGVLLLRATLLTHNGALAEAERTCRELLAGDECNAEAHYLLALCREGLGDREAARHHDQLAAYLDPGFAMPRLHLGLMARKARDRGAAGRDLAEALDLLKREEASRLLLFGGGFTRGALEALCAAELAACGGRET